MPRPPRGEGPRRFHPLQAAWLICPGHAFPAAAPINGRGSNSTSGQWDFSAIGYRLEGGEEYREISSIASELRQNRSPRRAGWRDTLGLPDALSLWAGTALGVGLLLLLVQGRLVLPWFVPVTSGVNIVCFAVTAALGALDARLRADSASLPAAARAAGSCWSCPLHPSSRLATPSRWSREVG